MECRPPPPAGHPAAMTGLARTPSAVCTPLSGTKSSSAHPWVWLARTLPGAGERQGQRHRLDETTWAGPGSHTLRQATMLGLFSQPKQLYSTSPMWIF